MCTAQKVDGKTFELVWKTKKSILLPRIQVQKYNFCLKGTFTLCPTLRLSYKQHHFISLATIFSTTLHDIKSFLMSDDLCNILLIQDFSLFTFDGFSSTFCESSRAVGIFANSCFSPPCHFGYIIVFQKVLLRNSHLKNLIFTGIIFMWSLKCVHLHKITNYRKWHPFLAKACFACWVTCNTFGYTIGFKATIS